jgi:hypothetical protein
MKFRAVDHFRFHPSFTRHFVTHDLVRDAAAIVDHHFAASRLPRGRPERSAVLREEDVK